MDFCLLLNRYSFCSVMWSLRKQPTFFQRHQWFPHDMTPEKRAQKFRSALAPQTSCRGENSNCVAKCWPFPQAMWCKALGILKGMWDLLILFTQKLTERLQVSFLSMMPSLHQLVWLSINQIRQSAMIWVTSWKCEKKSFSTKGLTNACFSESCFYITIMFYHFIILSS